MRHAMAGVNVSLSAHIQPCRMPGMCRSKNVSKVGLPVRSLRCRPRSVKGVEHFSRHATVLHCAPRAGRNEKILSVSRGQKASPNPQGSISKQTAAHCAAVHLSGSCPFVATVWEGLLLPYRQFELDLFDELIEDIDRFSAVSR